MIKQPISFVVFINLLALFFLVACTTNSTSIADMSTLSAPELRGNLNYQNSVEGNLDPNAVHLWVFNPQINDLVRLSLETESTGLAQLIGSNQFYTFSDTLEFVATSTEYQIKVLGYYQTGTYQLRADWLNAPVPTSLPTLIPTAIPTANEPNLGTGDVQVTLRWTGSADLDLHVIDPSNFRIYYGDKTSTTGGQLDVDIIPCNNRAAPKVENIFWETGQAPNGSYQVLVHYHPSCGDQGNQSYEVTLNRNGEIQRYTGVLEELNEMESIITFTKP